MNCLDIINYTCMYFKYLSPHRVRWFILEILLMKTAVGDIVKESNHERKFRNGVKQQRDARKSFKVWLRVLVL